MSASNWGLEPMQEIQQNMAPAPPRTWAPVRAGLAFSSALLLVLVYGNVADFVVLHDHPFPALAFWPAVWALLAVAVTMVIPSDLRTVAATSWAFGGSGLVVFLAGCVALAASFLSGGPKGDRVGLLSSADGRYQVEVLQWQAALGEPGWDVVIYRRDGLRGTEVYAGCFHSEASANYRAIQSVEAGSVRIATEEGLITIAFNPETMQFTQRVPVALCAGYG
jgi:hypothetical protein